MPGRFGSSAPKNPPPPPEAPLAIKLFAAPADEAAGETTASGGATLSPRMSLSEFYWSFFRLVCLEGQGREGRTFDAYEQSLGLWIRFTSDPPLCQIDDYTVAQFTAGLRSLPGRDGNVASNTVRKHCVHMQTLLDRTGARTRKNPQGKNLLDEAPFIPKPVVEEKDVEDNFTIAEITQMLEQCHVPVAPSELRPRERRIYWQQLILFEYNVGLRIGNLVRVEWRMVKPDPNGGFRLELPARSGIKKKQPKRFPLNQFAIGAIETMRPISGHTPHIWPWRNGTKAQSWMQEQRRRILTAAEIPEDRRFGYHGFRKAMCTELAEINPTAAMLGAGHKDMRTTTKHYLNKKVLANASAKLPQPIMQSTGDRQLPLF